MAKPTILLTDRETFSLKIVIECDRTDGSYHTDDSSGGRFILKSRSLRHRKPIAENVTDAAAMLGIDLPEGLEITVGGHYAMITLDHDGLPDHLGWAAHAADLHFAASLVPPVVATVVAEA